MKTDPRRFAPLGLVLALLAVLSFIGILIIKGLATTAVFTLPDPKLLDQGMWVSLAVFVLGLALTAFLDPEGTRKFFLGRQIQYGSNSVIMLLAFLGILFFINLIAYQNPVTKDVTEGQENSLAPETLNLLKTLPQPVSVRAYYSPQFPTDEVQKLLDNFKRSSAGKLTYEFKNPVQDPYTAQQDGVTRDGTIVILMGDHKELVDQTTEQGIDVSLLRLINPHERILYFLTGHGEHSMESTDDNSAFAQVKTALQNKSYTVKTLSLAGGQPVPADADAVIIGGPQKPLLASEVALLEAYLDKGGALIVMEDPRALTSFGDAPDPLADMLQAKWGITLEDDVIIDPNVPSSPLLAYADPQTYGTNSISAKLKGYDLGFFTSRSLKPAETAPEGVTLMTLLQTSADAWGETDIQSLQNNQTPTFDPATDKQGPVVIAVAAENSNTKGRLVTFGDSDFAVDALYQKGFSEVLINAADWSAEQENLMSLTPKNSVARTYEPPSTMGVIGIFLLSLCIIPLLVVGAGVASWYSRRRRG
jgi:ABC-type uncharacterized transport system involved in gliding motility auxiliary subunit